MRQFENLFEQALNIAIFDNVLQFLQSRHASGQTYSGSR